MKLIFFSDPHLGLVRNTHTTPASRKKLQEAVMRQFERVNNAETGSYLFCLGDLFDTFKVDNKTLVDAYSKSDCFHLAGNHDSSNRDNEISSLQVMAAFMGAAGDIAADNAEATRVGLFGVNESRTDVMSVNHKLTQELFEKSLTDAEEKVSAESSVFKILLLHCNYDSPFVNDSKSSSTLNLTRERAAKLLETFDYVLIGHEHEPRLDFDDKLIMVGNIHPTSFADIGNKFYWVLDTEGPDMLLHKCIWDSEMHYADFHHTELVNVERYSDFERDSYQFIDVTGTASPKDMPKIAKDIHNLWQICPNLLMLRNSVVVERPETSAVVLEDLGNRSSIPEIIGKMLADSPLLPTWKTFLALAEKP